MNIMSVLEGDSRVVCVTGDNNKALKFSKDNNEDIIKYSIENEGTKTVAIEEVILFEGRHEFNDDAIVYGEGYQMLSQYEGSLKQLKCYSDLTDHGHYKLPLREGYNTVYNMAWIYDKGVYTLIGYSSCRRFTGAIHINEKHLALTLNIEGKNIAPGDTISLEDVICLQGASLSKLLDRLAQELSKNHPPIFRKGEIPTGWCSWYCYGPNINEEIIQDNMKFIKDYNLDMSYIQIDDGYQPKMGDWLEDNPNFNMDMKSLCLDIEKNGFKSAIWVAPFIAEPSSKLFIQHPDWFIKDDEGEPLSSSTFTFGGWRCGPWYMLDGTHPEAQEYLTYVFRTMREEWKCSYFKLDANVWGAFPKGHYYDESATSVEAYRRGMDACLRGAGDDSFLLGCNAPMWPSLGTVHGMRVTNDISRTWKIISQLFDEGMNRNWQHNRLWVNDPDCIVLENTLTTAITKEEFDFHKAYILASGGMVLGSDIMMEMGQKNCDILNKCIKYRGEAGVFHNHHHTYCTVDKNKEKLIILFNNSDEESTITMRAEHRGILKDFWSEKVEIIGETITLKPHSARVFIPECQ